MATEFWTDVEQGKQFELRFKTDNKDYFHHVQEAARACIDGRVVQREPRPLEEWGEDYGDVLWWVFPVEEPPYVGSPLDAAWPGYHTHWTPLIVPEAPATNKED